MKTKNVNLLAIAALVSAASSSVSAANLDSEVYSPGENRTEYRLDCQYQTQNVEQNKQNQQVDRSIDIDLESSEAEDFDYRF